MAESTKFGKVLIIGAGLGGLALAQILHAHQVPYEIFERDDAPSSRKQGWAVALVESLPELEALLPEETTQGFHAVSVNHNTGDVDEIAFVNGTTGEVVGKFGGKRHGEPGYFLRASREAFRSYLWKTNDLPISANKYFTRYEVDEAGVTAYFKDGSTARGSLLVGADGLHSHVLDQLIGETEHRPVLSRYVPLFGELDLPPELYKPLRDMATSAILAGAPSVRLQIGMLSMAPDRSKARFFWAIMPRRDDPKPLSDWVQKASKKELYDFLMDTLKDLHPTMRDLVEHGGPDALSHPQPKFLEFVPPHDLPRGRVTVLGDSAHAMIPMRGAGANAAILDACELGKLLIEAKKESSDPVGVVEPYLAKMIPRGREAVLSSRAAGDPETDDPAVHFKKFQREKKD